MHNMATKFDMVITDADDDGFSSARIIEMRNQWTLIENY